LEADAAVPTARYSQARRSVLKISEPELSVTIAGIKLRNPVIAASGTFGYGREYEGLLDISSLGGICTKGLTLEPRPGNQGVRIYETPSGMMNSIGLENPGIRVFIEKELPRLKKLGPVIIANLSGSSVQEYVQGANLLGDSDVDMIELNISCPNVKSGGMAFGLDSETAASLTRQVHRAASKKPVIVKLTPNAPSIAAVAQACEGAGADAISLVNTFKAMVIDINTRKPVFENISAGLSGPCIRPIALRMVWELYEAVKVPIIGIGGIACVDDALEFLLAGAAAIQVGSVTFAHPPAMNEITAGIRAYMKEKNIAQISSLSIRKTEGLAGLRR
jgi:dihydroorotate dehydrogenase (NAD+) catalytic subunit